MNSENILRTLAGSILCQAGENDIVASIIAAATIKELDNRKEAQFVALEYFRKHPIYDL